MSLYYSPPETITTPSGEYSINTDFRAWIRFQRIVLSSGSNEQKADKIIAFMTEMGVPFSVESFRAILDFYIGKPGEKATQNRKSAAAFDFDQDSEYIFAAFLETYGIDLATEKLHWWKFLALFKSLPDGCKIKEIMHYRVADLSKIPKDRRKYYAEMKKLYALDNGAAKGGKTLREHVEALKKAQEENRMSTLRSSEQSSVD